MTPTTSSQRPDRRPAATKQPATRRPVVHEPGTRVPQNRGSRPEPEDVLEIVRWLDRDTLPDRIPTKRAPSSGVLKSVTIILAGDLTLGDAVYRAAERQTARNVILVADRLRLTGETVFDLSGRALDARARVGMDTIDRAGGDLFIAARELVVEDRGRLVLRSAGGRGPNGVNIRDHGRSEPRRDLSKSPRHGGGHGGDLVLSARRVTVGGRRLDVSDEAERDTALRQTLRDILVLDAPAGGAGPGLSPGEAGRLHLPASLEQAVEELEARTLRRYGYAFGQPAVSRWARRATSEWLLAALERALARLRLAALGDDPLDGVRALAHAVGLARDGAPLREDDRAAYGEHLDDLTTLADRFDDVLAVDAVTVQTPSGLPRRLDVFTAGADLTPRLAPSELLLRTRRVGSRELLGLLALDATRPDIVRLELEAQLTLDPWLAQRAAEALLDAGLEASAAAALSVDDRLFRDWTLTARPVVADGIVASALEVGPSGLVRATLELEAARAGLVLARLASSAGLPLLFDWRATRARGVSGVWQGPPLSLARRLGRPVTVDADGLHALADQADAVTVSYLVVADARDGNRFVALDPAVTLASGASAPLPTAPNPDESMEVPAEALTWTSDIDRPGRLFQTPRGDDLVETVSITNLLGHDLELGGLLFVEFELEVGVESGIESTLGPYRLAPAGALGDHVDITLLRTDSGPRRLRLRGAAHYEGGSRESFDFVTGDLVVKITSS